MSYRTGWGYSKEFFNATDTRNFFAGFHNAMEMEVEKMSDSEIVSCNFDEWANYLATKYSVIPISIFETNIERRLTEAKVKRANPFRGAPYERDLAWRATLSRGNPTGHQLFNLEGCESFGNCFQ